MKKSFALLRMPKSSAHDHYYPIRYIGVYNVLNDIQAHRLDIMVAQSTAKNPTIAKEKQITTAHGGELNADALGDMLITMGNRLKRLHRTGK